MEQRTFGQRLDAAVSQRGQVCVGIDPHPALLSAWGLADDVGGLARFASACVDAFGESAAVVKPQSAFFEQYGSVGVKVLEDTVWSLRSRGALVLLDVKRGDIGTTMSAYARAYLHPDSLLSADAVTVSPYLGTGSLAPAFELAREHGRGVFVLAATSNPEGPQFQHAVTGDRYVAQAVLDDVGLLNDAAGGAPGTLGSVGAVVGATIDPGVLDFSRLGGPVLAPGVGAQGGSADSVRRIFGRRTMRNVLPSVSREVLSHGPDPARLRDAVLRLADEFAFLRDG